MATHTEKEDQLAVLYIYGELDHAEKDAFLGHLRICQQCQALVEESGRISRLVSLSAEDAPEKAVLAVRRAAGEHCRAGKARIPARKFTGALPAIGFAFACAALFILFPRHPEPGKDGNLRVFASEIRNRNMRVEANLVKMAEISKQLDELEVEIESFKEQLIPAAPETGNYKRGENI